MARQLYVPQHSVIVVRDDKLVDAHAEYLRTGKAFKFTPDEIKDISAVNGGVLETTLREPTDEVGDADEVTAPVAPAASNTASDGTGTSVKGKAQPPAKDTDL